MEKIELNKLTEALNELYQHGLLTEGEYREKKDSLNNFYNILTPQEIENNIHNKKPIVQVINLTKHYKNRKVPAINDISFNIYPGEFHAFIGANGAGKTTTIKSIIGAYSNYNIKGEILIDSKKNYDVEAKIKVGYIPEYALFPKKIKTREYLILMTMLSGYEYKDAIKLTDDLLVKMNMEQFSNKRPDSLSSGQKKKILLAQALIHNPSILIMDEPAANLDPNARDELYSLLVSLQHEGKAIFLSSHILDEISKYATYATILDGGKIVFDGPLKLNSDLLLLYKKFVHIGSVDNKDSLLK